MFFKLDMSALAAKRDAEGFAAPVHFTSVTHPAASHWAEALQERVFVNARFAGSDDSWDHEIG